MCAFVCVCVCVRVLIRSRYLNECLDYPAPHAQQLLLPLRASHPRSRRAPATPATAATAAAVAGRLLSLLSGPFGQLGVSDEAADSPLAEAVKQNECTLRLLLLLLRLLVLRGLGEGDEFGRHLLLAERILPLEQAQEDASPSELRQLHRKREQRTEDRDKRQENRAEQQEGNTTTPAVSKLVMVR